MSDRLAEIEGIRDALYDIPDDISVPVSAGLARALLAVANAARDVPVQHEGRCAILIQAHYREDAQASGVFTTGALPACDCRLREFNAALANLEGGA